MKFKSDIAFFFRKKISGAFSINQIFEALAAEISKNTPVKSHNLKKSGGSLPVVLANTMEAMNHAVNGINHITGDVHYIACGLFKGRTVLTIHDCILLHRTPKSTWKFYAYLWIWYKLPIWFSDIVTTISEKSKDEIVAFTGCNPDKIVVIPNFVNEIYQYTPKPFNATRPRLLHIGVNQNKNLERLILALEGIPCVLEIVGDLKKNQLDLLAQYSIDYENYHDLTMEEMAERYRQADVVVFASTYEGFGMPVVEAQATGRPVVTSNIEPMMWVAGAESACFVDPFDPVSIRAGIERVVQDETFRNKLTTNGLENVKRYSIRQIAGQYIQVYRKFLN